MHRTHTSFTAGDKDKGKPSLRRALPQSASPERRAGSLTWSCSSPALLAINFMFRSPFDFWSILQPDAVKGYDCSAPWHPDYLICLAKMTSSTALLAVIPLKRRSKEVRKAPRTPPLHAGTLLLALSVGPVGSGRRK